MMESQNYRIDESTLVKEMPPVATAAASMGAQAQKDSHLNLYAASTLALLLIIFLIFYFFFRKR